MKSRRGMIMTVLVVLLMLSVSFTSAISEQSDADLGNTMPTMNDYAYVMKYSTSNGNILGVWKDGNITASNISGGSNGKANSASKGAVGDWGFVNGVGPFNSFYAAINTSSSTGSDRMNTGVGQVAYILNPNDLTKTLSGSTFTASNFNIMFIVPTVYWYSDTAKGLLYMSNTNNNPNITAYDSSINSKMFPYAHNMTATIGSNGIPTGGHTYPYIAIGVYEGIKDSSNKLRSIPDSSTNTSLVCGKQSANNLLTYAQNNNSGLAAATNDSTLSSSVGKYGVWDYYEWTLYKMMSQTVIGTRDAQSVIGKGTVNLWKDNQATGTSSSRPGRGDTAGPYNSSGDKINGNGSYSKLFIENSWGSVWEYVQNAPVKDGKATPKHITEGTDYTNGSITVPYGWKKSIEYQSTASASWDAVASNNTSPNVSSTSSNDIRWAQSGTRALFVGGSFNNNNEAGLSAWSSYYSASESYTNFGARITYVMTVDAVGSDRVHSVTVINSDAHGTTTSLLAKASVGELISFTNTPIANYRLKNVTVTYSDTGVELSDKSLIRGAFTMPSGDVTITPEYEEICTVGVVRGGEGSMALSIGGVDQGLMTDPITVSLAAARYYLSSENSGELNINDVELGLLKQYKITATPATGFDFGQYDGGSDTEKLSNTDSANPIAIPYSTLYVLLSPPYWEVIHDETVIGGKVVQSSTYPSEDVYKKGVQTGVIVVLKVVVDNGYELRTINLSCEGSSTVPALSKDAANKTVSFTMPTSNVTILPEFERQAAVSAATGGTVSVTETIGSDTHSYTESTLRIVPSQTNYSISTNTFTATFQDYWGETRVYEITATPGSGYNFDRFDDGDEVYDPAGGLIGLKTTIRAHFYAYTWTVGVLSGGSIKHGNETAGNALAGDTIMLTVAPESGKRLASVTFSVTDVSDKEITLTSVQFIMPAGNVTINATFEDAVEIGTAYIGEGTVSITRDEENSNPVPYYVSTINVKSGATYATNYIEGSGGDNVFTITDVELGKTVVYTITATPSHVLGNEYLFKQFDDGAETPTPYSNTVSGTFNAPKTVRAWFFQYSWNVNQTVGGTIGDESGESNETAAVGSIVGIHMFPDDHKILSGIIAMVGPNPIELTETSYGYSFVMPQGNVEITPTWADAVIITFEMNGHGTQIAPKSIMKGTAVDRPADPFETNCTFGGWFEDSDLTVGWDFSTVLNEDVEIFALWTLNVYTVTFMVDGSVYDSKQTNEQWKLSDMPFSPSKSGYSFTGWYEQDHEDRITEDTVFNADTTVYAQWYKPTPTPMCTITFRSEVGGWATPSVLKVSPGSTISVDGSVMYITNGRAVWEIDAVPDIGYALDGWSVTEGTITSSMTIDVTFDELQLIGIEVHTAPKKLTYQEGETFDPKGLVMTLTYSGQAEWVLGYKGNESLFSFSPSLSEPLKAFDKKVTVTYGEMSVQQDIAVKGVPFDIIPVILGIFIVFVLILIVIAAFPRRGHRN